MKLSPSEPRPCRCRVPSADREYAKPEASARLEAKAVGHFRTSLPLYPYPSHQSRKMIGVACDMRCRLASIPHGENLPLTYLTIFHGRAAPVDCVGVLPSLSGDHLQSGREARCPRSEGIVDPLPDMILPDLSGPHPLAQKDIGMYEQYAALS